MILFTIIVLQFPGLIQVRIQDLCKGGKQNLADIALWSRGDEEKVGLKTGSREGGVPGP